MAKIEIIFAENVVTEMETRGAKFPEGFNNGPVFEDIPTGDYGAAEGSYCVRSNGNLYCYPLHNIRRVKVSGEQVAGEGAPNEA